MPGLATAAERHLAAPSRRAICGGLLAVALPLSSRAGDAILGDRPRYTDRRLSAVPNAQALGKRIWAPGLDDGFVPQGLTVFGEEVLVAAYRSTDPKQDNGPSRLFRLARSDGRLLGGFDLPAAYGHPGGLAMADSTLYVANSGRLIALALTPDPQSEPRILGEWRVERGMGPSFLAGDNQALCFGPFRREGEAKLYRLPLERLAADRTKPITPADTDRAIPLPLLVQGAAVDAGGVLWISTSAGNRQGALHRIDAASGEVLARYPMPGGIEDLGFAADGRLWAVSEAGSQRWNRWDTFYPLVFEIDVAKLMP